MDDNKFQREVLDRLIVLETLLKEQDYKGVKKTADEANAKSVNNEQRIVKLENSNSWLIRLVIGALILGVLAFIYGI